MLKKFRQWRLRLQPVRDLPMEGIRWHGYDDAEQEELYESLAPWSTHTTSSSRCPVYGRGRCDRERHRGQQHASLIGKRVEYTWFGGTVVGR